MPLDSHKLCVAPMMDWTDRHCRVFHRLLSPGAVLYTEMITADAVIYGDRERLLGFDASEHPVALQLGGSDPAKLAEAARIGRTTGYDEVNLNVGCPSDRVREGRFGACLMAEPELVARCVGAMSKAVDIPVTIKCRIGIDDQDSETDFANFIETVASAPCSIFIVHARKAWLNGLSPKQNRDVPPLNYDRVHRMKQARPDLQIIINGAIQTVSDCCAQLDNVDGVMLGRAAYQDPWVLAKAQQLLFAPDPELPAPDLPDPDLPDTAMPVRADILRALVPYTARHLDQGGRLNNITRHILGLYRGQHGGRAFRRYLSENATGPDAGINVLNHAIELMERASEPIAEARFQTTS